MLITIIYSKVLFGGSRVQMGAATVTFTEIISWAKSLAIDSLGVIPSFVHIGFIIFTTILILIFYNNKKEKALFTLKYLFIILYAIVMSLAPIVGGSGLELTPRTCIAYSCTIGISLFILLWIILQNNKKFQLNLLAVITIITFALNFMLYVIITNQHLKVNKLDKENCLKIEKVIEKYEEVNNTKITKIATIRRTDSNQYYPGFIHAGTLTRKALNTWPVRETIVFYTGRKLEFTAFPMEIYKEHFSGLEFEDFSLRQVVIKGDTLYFYGG